MNTVLLKMGMHQKELRNTSMISYRCSEKIYTLWYEDQNNLTNKRRREQWF